MRITIKNNLRQLEKEFGKLPLEHQAKVIPAAMNKAGAKGFTTAKRSIAKALRVTQKEFVKGSQNRRMYVQKAYRARLNVSIVALGRPFNLTRFGAVPSGRGMTANVMGRTRNVAGAFKLNAKGGPVLRRKGAARLPLKQIWGASAADAMRIKQVQDAVTQRVQGELGVEYQRAIKRETRRIKSRLARRRRR